MCVSVDGEHTKISFLLVNIAGPVFVVAEDPINGVGLGGIVIVYSGEMVPVILLFGILVSSSFKIKPKPAFNLQLLANILIAMILIDHDSSTFLGVICSRFVVQHGIKIDSDTILVGGLAQIEKFLFRAEFRSYAALCVELA